VTGDAVVITVYRYSVSVMQWHQTEQHD